MPPHVSHSAQMSQYVDREVAAALDTIRGYTAVIPVLSRRALIDLGVNDTLQSAMFRRGLLERLRHGVYVLHEHWHPADPLERHRLDIAAAATAAREQLWAFGPSAALLLEMPLPYSPPDQLHLVRGSGKDERGLRRPSRHRLVIPDAHVVTGPIDPEQTSLARGVPVVSPALAAVSTAAGLTSSRWRTALIDAALWKGAGPADVETLIDLWRHLGMRTELLSALGRARVGAQSVLETFSRLAFVELGLPEPVLQHPFYDEDGLIGYVDMWWPSLGVIGEADGAVKYTDRTVLLREKRREDRLRALGPAIVRWGFDAIETNPDQVVAQIWRASVQRRGGSNPRNSAETG